MSLDLDQIRADVEAGTPGPWAERMGDICVTDTDGDDLVIAGMNKSFGARSSAYSTMKPKNPASQANARRIARLPDLEARVLSDATRIAAADAAMALVARAADHLQTNGMKPGWGTAKDDLNAALAIYRATAPASPTSEGDET